MCQDVKQEVPVWTQGWGWVGKEPCMSNSPRVQAGGGVLSDTGAGSSVISRIQHPQAGGQVHFQRGGQVHQGH